jgi:hypothetical protein
LRQIARRRHHRLKGYSIVAPRSLAMRVAGATRAAAWARPFEISRATEREFEMPNREFGVGPGILPGQYRFAIPVVRAPARDDRTRAHFGCLKSGARAPPREVRIGTSGPRGARFSDQTILLPCVPSRTTLVPPPGRKYHERVALP